MTRRDLVVLAGCGVLALGAVGADVARSAPSPACERDVACSVVVESARSGWPHRVTRAELREVAGMIRAAHGARAVVCRAPGPVWVCGVRLSRSSSPFRVGVRVWEDGSFRVSFPGRGGR